MSDSLGEQENLMQCQPWLSDFQVFFQTLMNVSIDSAITSKEIMFPICKEGTLY